MKIDNISISTILDSGSKETIEVAMSSGTYNVTTSVPSGESMGSREAAVLPVQKAIIIFQDLKEDLLRRDFLSLLKFDELLINKDLTPNKETLGGNLTLALSLAFTKLLAKYKSLEVYELISELTNIKPSFPLLFVNLLEGGLHATNGLPFQEYLLVPTTTRPSEGLNTAKLFIEKLKNYLLTQRSDVSVGHEGGFSISSDNPILGLEILTHVANVANDQRLRNTKFAIDAAASTFFESGRYKVGGEVLDRPEMLLLYSDMINKFRILSIEDPFSEYDIEGFTRINKEMGDKVWIMGDDLTVTNPRIIQEMAESKAINAIIIKPNQVGTVSETLEAIRLARSFEWKIVISNRGRETEESFIADLAVGCGADGIKAGDPMQKERMTKYQRLIEIENKFTAS